jgi:parallel beta-helix repeat protein
LIRKGLTVVIIILFVTTGMILSTAQYIEKPQTTSKNNWLYVGGDGPGNYTRIQDAINDSYDGNTVFVYTASSPYYENVVINKSIALIGENRNTTIIDGKRIDNPLWIKASFVNISGFTISNSSDYSGFAGIYVIEKKMWPPDDPPLRLSNISIFNCIIKNNYCGVWFTNTYALNISYCIIHNNSGHRIYIRPSSHVKINNCGINHNGDMYPGAIVIAQDDRFGVSENITISNCSISHNVLAGIWIIENSQDIDIYHNNILENTNYGINVIESNVNIYDNHIFNNGIGEDWNGGIYLQDCIKCITINDNNIETNNQYGLYLLRSSTNSINNNNFINNTCNAYFRQFSLFNHWNGNYWTDWVGLGPKLIKGKLGEVYIPWFQFDWHPAKEPYDVPDMS